MSWSAALFNVANSATLGVAGLVYDYFYTTPQSELDRLEQAALDRQTNFANSINDLYSSQDYQFDPIPQIPPAFEYQLPNYPDYVSPTINPITPILSGTNMAMLEDRIALQEGAIAIRDQIGRELVDMTVNTVLDGTVNSITQPIPDSFELAPLIEHLFFTYRRPDYTLGFFITTPTGGRSYYTVNTRNFMQQLALISGADLDYEEVTKTLLRSGAERGFYFRRIDWTHQRIGAFFPYMIREESLPLMEPKYIDHLAQKCQIFDEDAFLFMVDNLGIKKIPQCLVWTLSLLCPNNNNLDRIGRYMIGNNINTYDMRAIADTLGEKIIVHMIRDSGKEDKLQYGTTTNSEIHICLYKNHYFPFLLLTTNRSQAKNLLVPLGYTQNKNKVTNVFLVWVLFNYGHLENMPNEYYSYFNEKQEPDVHNLRMFNTYEIEYKPKSLLHGDKIKDMELAIVYADTEAYPVGKHVPYSVSMKFMEQKIEHFFHWEKCIDVFMNHMVFLCEQEGWKGAIVYFHNLGYDGSFFQDKYGFRNDLSKGTKTYGFRIDFKKHVFIFKDTLAYLPMALKDMPASFGLKTEKEVYPYRLYSKEVCQGVGNSVPLEKALEFIKEDEKEEFIRIASEGGFIQGKRFFHKQYCRYYNDRDVEILEKCFTKTADAFYRDFNGQDIHAMWSISTCAQQHLKKEGCFKGCYSVSGAAKEFMTKCAYGGRCGSLGGKAYHVKVDTMVIDFTQLYPVAMIILGYIGGYLLGKPKVFECREELPDRYDAYFAEIEVISIPKALDWPNVVLGTGKYCSLDVKRWEIFEGMKEGENYRIIRGYYYDEGRLPTIIKAMGEIIARRTRKKNADPVDETNICEKNAANGAYGKHGQKEYTKSKITKTKMQSLKYQDKFHYRIDVVHEGEKRDIIEEFKRDPDSKNEAHIYSEILAMSKILTAIVMYECDKVGIKVIYHDTDSFTIKYKDYLSGKIDHIFDLDKFSTLVCNVLGLGESVREDMLTLMRETKAGTLHNDIEPKDADKGQDIVMSELVIAGKKLYCGTYGYLSCGKRKEKLKKACKGVRWEALLFTYSDPMQMFRDLVYKQDEKDRPVIDAAVNGLFCVERNNLGHIIQNESFPRTLKCEKELIVIE